MKNNNKKEKNVKKKNCKCYVCACPDEDNCKCEVNGSVTHTEGENVIKKKSK